MKTTTFMSLLRLCLALTVLATTGAVAAAQDYAYQKIDPPWITPETGETQIVWVNNNGLIAVQYADSDYNFRMALLSHGEWIKADVDAPYLLGGSSLNSKGEFAFNYSDDGLTWHVSMYRNGVFTPFPDIPNLSWIGALNDNGVLAGQCQGYSMFVWNRSDYVTVSYPGTDVFYTSPYAVNDSGTIVGQYLVLEDSGQGWFFLWSHGFLYDSKTGVFTAFDVPGAHETILGGINNHGDMVGIAVSAEREFSAFLYHKGQFTILQNGDFLNITPYSINDRGQIAGVYRDVDGIQHGFIATPMQDSK